MNDDQAYDPADGDDDYLAAREYAENAAPRYSYTVNERQLSRHERALDAVRALGVTRAELDAHESEQWSSDPETDTAPAISPERLASIQAALRNCSLRFSDLFDDGTEVDYAD